MIPVVLMSLVTAVVLLFLAEIRRISMMEAAEIVLSKAWGYRFERQMLEEKMDNFLEKNQKYHMVSEKKAAVKIKKWKKLAEEYRKNEEKYLLGSCFTVVDVLVLLGYRILTDFRLDNDNSMLRKLTADCEHSGYVELERNQETGNNKNSYIYSKYILSSFFAFIIAGVAAGCFVGILLSFSGKSGTDLLLLLGMVILLFSVVGYLPFDNLRVQAEKRKREIERELPDAISKITLLVTAGMSITNALEKTALSGNTLIYRELRLVMKEIGQGRTMQEALVRIQCRCDNPFLDKIVTIISKSYVAGNVNMADDLRAINDESWMDKKHNARRMGESVQNRLYIPTILMFVGLLIVIIVPIMSGLGM